VTKRLVLVLLLALLAIGSAGCRLLGVSGPSDGSRIDVERAIESIAAAVQLKDAAGVAVHLAEYFEVTSGTVAPLSLGLMAQSQIPEFLERIWGDVEFDTVEVVLGRIQVDGGSAVAEGSFTLSFTDAGGAEVRCAGTGRVHLEYAAGQWVVTHVDVLESECTGGTPGEPGSPGVPGLEPPPAGVPGYYFDRCQYLVLGFQGEQVAALQTALKFLGYYSGKIDGDFGPLTDRAVRAFQSAKGLYVDGEAGPKTYAELNKALASKKGYYLCGVADERADAGPTMLTMSALRKGTAFETPVYIYDSPTPGPTLVFIGCIHGNERSGHLALTEAIDRGITVSRGRLVIVPAFNKIACEQNRRTLSRSGSALSGKDFNRMFPVGSSPTYTIAKEMWDLIKSQPNLAFVVDFHDGFVNSLGNTLIHTRQAEAGSVARRIRDALNEIRPSGATGPKWRALTEPISGSLTRKVGRDLGIPAVEVELSGRSPGDPLSLRKKYAWRVIRMMGYEYGMAIGF